MFARVVEFLEALAAGSLGEAGFKDSEEMTAIAALLYRVVTIDGIVRDVERSKLREILQERFDITAAKLEQLIAAAKAEHADTAGLFPFTSIIMRSCSRQEREEIAKAMWRLALCDGEFHEFEKNLLERACELMELPTEKPEL